jgi:hypothetical protein
VAWKIHGDARAVQSGGYDGSIWEWQVIAESDPSQQRFVLVKMSGSAMAMGEEALSTRIALARQTQGGSEVEMVLGWPDPPKEINIHSSGIQTAGGDPGEEQREINEIADWFDERGAIMVFAGHGVGEITTHSAHILARDIDQHLYHSEGPSRVKAARRAKERWDAEGHGVLLGKLESGGTSDAKLTLTIDRETVKTLRSEGYRVVWTEPTDPSDPIWMGQAFNDDGDLLEMALGKNPEDVLLELAQTLLPGDWKSGPPGQG